tara:strand:+ start:7321 stop:9252 length:1932 start_codon:yes stop_codon:yes gene_type:complete
MTLSIRKSSKLDLPFLERIENDAFPQFQRSQLKAISSSIKNPNQEVLIAENEQHEAIGSLIIIKYKKSVRIYSIAIVEAFRNKGVGSFLIEHAVQFAKQYQKERVLLEVHTGNEALINWYKSKGFKAIQEIEDYYAEGEAAIKMELRLDTLKEHRNDRNIIVINQPQQWSFDDVNAKIISVKEYINNPIYHSNTDLRIFNLCSSYKYQSFGYYVSLLAEARNQRVIPNSITIRDFKLVNVIRSVTSDLGVLIDETLKKATGNSYELQVYFGQSSAKGFNKLAMKLYQLLEAPLFKVHFIRHDTWIVKDIKVLTLSRLPETELPLINEFARKYFEKKRFNKSKFTNYKYDLAILVNPDEKTPPSCQKALQKFKNAANKKGIYTEFITKSDFDKINEFDALFIRETTGVNNHCYEFSRMAYAEGLVVIDDPWSILKCSNKIYQNEVFRKHKLLTPQTTVFTKNLFNKKQLDDLRFPLVLKQPDSAFSLGIIKVENKEETVSALDQLFKKSDMVICQEFLYSDFDWRIGILDNKALFACKYYMSKGHWQIYNWKGDAEENSGDAETMSIDQVPEIILKTAIKAAGFFGDGLYGVDLKMIDGKVYVIEVNDNPNIDVGVEDAYLKDELYDRVIDSIYKRIETSKNVG